MKPVLHDVYTLEECKELQDNPEGLLFLAITLENVIELKGHYACTEETMEKLGYTGSWNNHKHTSRKKR